MCALHLTRPSAHTVGAVGSRCCGARGAVGDSDALLKCLTSVMDNSCRSRDSNPQPRVKSPTALSIRPRLPLHGCPFINQGLAPPFYENVWRRRRKITNFFILYEPFMYPQWKVSTNNSKFPSKKFNVKCIVNSKCLKSITILFEHVSGKHIYTQNHTHFVVVWVTIDLHCMNWISPQGQ